MWFKKIKNYFANKKIWTKKSQKNVLRLVFRDYSCFFRERFPESFICCQLFYRDLYNWLGKTSLEFIGTQGGGWERYFLHLSNDFYKRKSFQEVRSFFAYCCKPAYIC